MLIDEMNPSFAEVCSTPEAKAMLRANINTALEAIFEDSYCNDHRGYIDFLAWIKVKYLSPNDYGYCAEIWEETPYWKTKLISFKFIMLDDERGLQVQHQWSDVYFGVPMQKGETK